MRLERERILITGGGSCIGLELARRLADANDVVFAGRTASKLQTARDNLPAVRTLQLDVTSEQSAAGVTAWLEAQVGGLDVLVNSAGVMRGGGLSSPDAPSSARDELDVNVGGAVRMMRLALPLLNTSPHAEIVFISSAVALAAVPRFSVYASTKAGMHSFACSLRAELVDTPIQVFEPLPPVVETELAQDFDVPKIALLAAADAVIDGITRDKEQIPFASIRALVVMARLAPRIAHRLVQRALLSSPVVAEPAENR